MRTVLIKTMLALIVFIALLGDMSSAGYAKNTQPDFDWWWVVYEHEKRDSYESVVYRPLWVSTVNSGNLFESCLIPVYWRQKKERKDTRRYFLGIWNSMDYMHTDGVRDVDKQFFPILWGRSADQADQYTFIWPVGGTIKGKLAQERISAYVFPLFLLYFVYPPVFSFSWEMIRTIAIFYASVLIPVYADYESHGYRAKAIFWPLIQWGKNTSRDDIRVLPFYVHNSKKNYYDSYQFLMIGNYQRTYRKNDLQETLFVLPLFGKRWSRSDSMESGMVLWPFFSWGYNKKTGTFELNFPWPLVQIMDSENPYIRKMIFFPFYGEYEFKDQKTFFLTPLYFTLEKNKKAYYSKDTYCLLWFIQHHRRDYVREDPVYGKSWRFTKVWPLFQYEYDDRGNSYVTVFALFPWRDPEGFERAWQPFVSIFEYKKFQSGEARLGLLLRLYYQRWGDDFLFIKVPLVFSYGSFSGRLTEFSVLLSAFSYVNDRRGKYLRLFWIPIDLQRSPGDAELAMAGQGADCTDDTGVKKMDDWIESSRIMNDTLKGNHVHFTKELF